MLLMQFSSIVHSTSTCIFILLSTSGWSLLHQESGRNLLHWDKSLSHAWMSWIFKISSLIKLSAHVNSVAVC